MMETEILEEETQTQEHPQGEAETKREAAISETEETEDAGGVEQKDPLRNLIGKIEAILFISGEPVEMKDLARALSVDRGDLMNALFRLRDEYDYGQRGFCLRIFGSHVQLTTRAMYAQDVVHLLQPVQRQTLSQAIMETLAVVAYRQPVTKAEVEQVRGVKCDYSIQSLTQKGLICEVGRKDALGRPILYGTTDAFLQHFGISSLEELPELPEKAEEGKAGEAKEGEKRAELTA